MPEEISTGVAEAGVTSGETAGASPAASPAAEAQQTNNFTGETAGQQPVATTEGAGTATAVAETDPDEGIQPETFSDEKARNAFIHLRQQKQDARELRGVVDPVFTDAAKSFGIDWSAATADERRAVVATVESNHKMVDSLYGQTPEARGQFFESLFQQSPEAYFRLENDLATNQRMTALVLREMGFDLPDGTMGLTSEMQRAVDWLKSGSWRDQPRADASGADTALSEETLGLLNGFPDLQAAYKTLDKVGRAYADTLEGEQLGQFLRREKQAQDIQRSEADRHQREQQAFASQREQAVEETKQSTYHSVRNIVKESLAKIFPGNEEAQNLVIAAAESRLYSSEEGAALWNELEGFIEGGETRLLQAKLPQMIARARAIATETAKYLNERESKARQFDELMRMASPEEIMRYLTQARGAQTVMPAGSKVASNGNLSNMPDPTLAGKYEPANILSYWPRG